MKRDPQDAVEALWSAVVAQAWADFFDTPAELTNRGFEEARAFLFDDDGEWKQSRHDVCVAAGVNAHELKEIAERHLAAA